MREARGDIERGDAPVQPAGEGVGVDYHHRVGDVSGRKTVLVRLSDPAKVAPGASTRRISPSRRSCNSADGTWWSMVNDTAPVKVLSAKHRRRVALLDGHVRSRESFA